MYKIGKNNQIIHEISSWISLWFHTSMNAWMKIEKHVRRLHCRHFCTNLAEKLIINRIKQLAFMEAHRIWAVKTLYLEKLIVGPDFELNVYDELHGP